MVACATTIGVCVEPGPRNPATSPAMSRSRAPPSGDDTSVTSSASRFWYRGAVSLSAAGRFTQSCTPWNKPPLTTSSSGGVSMCRSPEPAVIHCVPPFVIEPPPPWESWCRNVPSMMYVTVSKPRCGSDRSPRLVRGVFDLTHLVHVDERVEVTRIDAGEGPTYRKALALVPLRCGRDGTNGTIALVRSQLRKAGQRGGVGGDGWHLRSLKFLRTQI